MCIGSSVAELVSAYPTAGGMYFVTKHVVPDEQVPIFSWVQGWCNLLGQTAGVSSVAYTVSQMLLACASMNSEYSYSPYKPLLLCRGGFMANAEVGLRCKRSLYLL
jgi:amino acid transporter